VFLPLPYFNTSKPCLFAAKGLEITLTRRRLQMVFHETQGRMCLSTNNCSLVVVMVMMMMMIMQQQLKE
jgi:hypothetical protein